MSLINGTDTGLIRPDLQTYCGASNLAFNEKVKGLISGGRTVYHFGFGQAPFPVCPPMVEALKQEAGQNAYLPVTGIPSLRQAICDFHRQHDSLEGLDPEQVVVGPGTKELIFLLMEIFNGDVLVVSPSWTTYQPQSKLAHHTPYVVETDMQHKWRIEPQMIEKTIKQHNLTGNKLLVLCNPCNPTGTSYQKEHLVALGNYCRQQNIIVLCDEIYSRLHYTASHDTLYRYYPEGTIVSSGFSKWASAGGWRMGYHIYPQELTSLRRHVVSAGSHTYSCAPAPMQYAVAKAMTHNIDACNEYIQHTSRIMKAVGDFCYRELTSIGVKAIPPTAGYYFMPDFEVCRKGFEKRGITTGEQMCKAMLEECDVALMSGGPAFLRPIEELTVRFCYVNFDGSEGLAHSMDIGLDKPLPEHFIDKYATPVRDGVRALKEWLLKHIET